jgi:alkanesulfonate monooxygenase SsuD/methylene tetrahydromethanopterin reductase-like flavin-dependent oxidoreductase (luciferase family)
MLFVNGGSVEEVRELVSRAKRHAQEHHGRSIRVMLSAFVLLRDDDLQARRAADALAEAADEETLRYFDGQVDRGVVAHNRGAARDRIEANLGLTSGLIGGRETIVRRIAALQEVGVDAIALKMEDGPEHALRFQREVIAVFGDTAARPSASQTWPMPPSTIRSEPVT